MAGCRRTCFCTCSRESFTEIVSAIFRGETSSFDAIFWREYKQRVAAVVVFAVAMAVVVAVVAAVLMAAGPMMVAV